MYAQREIKWSVLANLSWLPVLILTIWSTFVVALHLLFEELGYNLVLTFEPIELLGITVALYLGFKNNQAYDRFWEGRKIWGGIVNYSRSWANGVLTFLHSAKPEDEREVKAAAQVLVRRHIAWLWALTHNLRKKSHGSPTPSTDWLVNIQYQANGRVFSNPIYPSMSTKRFRPTPIFPLSWSGFRVVISRSCCLRKSGSPLIITPS